MRYFLITGRIMSKRSRDAAVGGAAQARDGLELVGIDEHVFVNDTIPHVKADHFADDDAAAPGFVADLDNVVDDALHVDRRFEHARGLDDFAGDGREAGRRRIH